MQARALKFWCFAAAILVSGGALVGWWIVPYLLARQAVATVTRYNGTVGTRSIVQPLFIPTTRNIDKVDFRGAAITDEDLASIGPALRSLPRLRYLILSDTGISDRGLIHLRNMPSVEYVYLDGTSVTEDGVQVLRQQLPGAHTITR